MYICIFIATFLITDFKTYLPQLQQHFVQKLYPNLEIIAQDPLKLLSFAITFFLSFLLFFFIWKSLVADAKGGFQREFDIIDEIFPFILLSPFLLYMLSGFSVFMVNCLFS